MEDDDVIEELGVRFLRMEQVHQATGMIMAQLGVGAEVALLRLRAAAYAADRPLIEMARDVVARTIALPPDD